MPKYILDRWASSSDKSRVIEAIRHSPYTPWITIRGDEIEVHSSHDSQVQDLLNRSGIKYHRG